MAESASPPSAAASGGPDLIRINIRQINQDTFSVEASPSMLVGDLKDLLAQRTMTPVDRQRLIYVGKVLKNDQTLDSYHVKDGNTIHLICRPEDAPANPTNEGPQVGTAASTAPATAGAANRVDFRDMGNGVVMGTVSIDTGEISTLPQIIAPVLQEMGVNLGSLHGLESAISRAVSGAENTSSSSPPALTTPAPPAATAPPQAGNPPQNTGRPGLPFPIPPPPPPMFHQDIFARQLQQMQAMHSHFVQNLVNPGHTGNAPTRPTPAATPSAAPSPASNPPGRNSVPSQTPLPESIGTQIDGLARALFANEERWYTCPRLPSGYRSHAVYMGEILRAIDALLEWTGRATHRAAMDTRALSVLSDQNIRSQVEASLKGLATVLRSLSALLQDVGSALLTLRLGVLPQSGQVNIPREYAIRIPHREVLRGDQPETPAQPPPAPGSLYLGDGQIQQQIDHLQHILTALPRIPGFSSVQDLHALSSSDVLSQRLLGLHSLLSGLSTQYLQLGSALMWDEHLPTHSRGLADGLAAQLAPVTLHAVTIVNQIAILLDQVRVGGSPFEFHAPLQPHGVPGHSQIFVRTINLGPQNPAASTAHFPPIGVPHQPYAPQPMPSTTTQPTVAQQQAPPSSSSGASNSPTTSASHPTASSPQYVEVPRAPSLDRAPSISTSVSAGVHETGPNSQTATASATIGVPNVLENLQTAGPSAAQLLSSVGPLIQSINTSLAANSSGSMNSAAAPFLQFAGNLLSDLGRQQQGSSTSLPRNEPARENSPSGDYQDPPE